MSWPAPYALTCLEFLWDRYHDNVAFPHLPDNQLLDHFYFCLLGGFGISYELNLSAYTVLKSKGYLQLDFLSSASSRFLEAVVEELSKPQFLPLTSTGNRRKYRYPRAKARTLVRASHWLLHSCGFQLKVFLEGDPLESRDRLITCPGMGYKTASWFLRNIGHGDRLAIIDIHVYRALRSLGVIPNHLSTNKDYLKIEQLFLEACDQIGAVPSQMDLILWLWERGSQNGLHAIRPSI